MKAVVAALVLMAAGGASAGSPIDLNLMRQDGTIAQLAKDGVTERQVRLEDLLAEHGLLYIVTPADMALVYSECVEGAR